MHSRLQKYIFALLAAAAIASLPSCKDDMYDNSPKEPLELSQTEIIVGNGATTVHIGITARGQGWTVTGSESWCTVDPESGDRGISQVTVTFTEYSIEGEDKREATLTFTSGGETKTVKVTQHSTSKIPLPTEHPDHLINEEIRLQYLDKWYYNGETRTTDADYNQSYDKFYSNYLKFLKKNDLDGNAWASNNERYIYSYIEQNPKGTTANDTPPLNYGMEFELLEWNGKLAARILYVLKNSPADRAKLKRGDWFYKVNDVRMGNWITNKGDYQYNYLIDTLVSPIPGDIAKLGMLTFRNYSLELTDMGNSVTLSPENFRGNPILHHQFITRANVDTQDPTRTGYLVYNSFDPHFRDELIAEFTQFKNEAGNDGLTHFILDLRYNKSGTVEMAGLMGNLLVPEAARGKVFAQYKFAGGETATATFEPDETSGVKAPTILIITSKYTAGAAELLINALKGIEPDVKLVVIGNITEGMNVGMVKQTYPTEDNEYNMWIAAFTCTNALGEWDYRFGLTPATGKLSEWEGDNLKWPETWGWRGTVGATEDPLLKKAMDYVVGNEEMPKGSVFYETSRKRAGYVRRFCVPDNMVMETKTE
uniref:Tail specific protease domain-containing protein n=1 Tax=termite gut metagenome TaxID=433724 RepID=S0DDQ2_9ZZZZ